MRRILKNRTHVTYARHVRRPQNDRMGARRRPICARHTRTALRPTTHARLAPADGGSVGGEWTWPAPAIEQELDEPRGVQLMRLDAVRDVVVRLLVSDLRPLLGLSDEPWMALRSLRSRMTCLCHHGRIFLSIDRSNGKAKRTPVYQAVHTTTLIKRVTPI
jgi:hypothetical protein